MPVGSPAPSSSPPPPPPSRRALDAHEKVIIGAGAVGLVIVAVALLTLPAPDSLATGAAPVIAVAAVPTLAGAVIRHVNAAFHGETSLVDMYCSIFRTRPQDSPSRPVSSI